MSQLIDRRLKEGDEKGTEIIERVSPLALRHMILKSYDPYVIINPYEMDD